MSENKKLLSVIHQVTDSQVVNYSKTSGDINPIHLDSSYAKNTQFGDFLIIKGGENIYPAELENVLYQHPDIIECAVIGIPHKLLGEDVCAFVKCKEESQISETELKEFCKNNISNFKSPQKIIIINLLNDLDDIPKGPTKKILYRDLKKYYMEKYQKNSKN